MMQQEYITGRPTLDHRRSRAENILQLAEDTRLATGSAHGMGRDVIAEAIYAGESDTHENGYMVEAFKALLDRSSNLSDLLADELRKDYRYDDQVPTGYSLVSTERKDIMHKQRERMREELEALAQEAESAGSCVPYGLTARLKAVARKGMGDLADAMEAIDVDYTRETPDQQ